MTTLDLIDPDVAGDVYRQLFMGAKCGAVPPVLMSPDPGTGRIMLSPILITGGDPDEKIPVTDVVGSALMTLLARTRTIRWVVVCTHGYSKRFPHGTPVPSVNDGTDFRAEALAGNSDAAECLIAMGVHCDGRSYIWGQRFRRENDSAQFEPPEHTMQASGLMYDVIAEIMAAHHDETLRHLN